MNVTFIIVGVVVAVLIFLGLVGLAVKYRKINESVGSLKAGKDISNERARLYRLRAKRNAASPPTIDELRDIAERMSDADGPNS